MAKCVRVAGIQLRKTLKKPFGNSEVFSTERAVKFLKEHAHGAGNKPLVICVGDICSSELLKSGYEPDIIVFDTKYLRKDVDEEVIKIIKNSCKNLLSAKNDPGTICCEAEAVIEKLICERKKGCVQIDGEEDMLALVAVCKCKPGDIVVYGQPHEGIVIVEANADKITLARKLYGAMETRLI